MTEYSLGGGQSNGEGRGLGGSFDISPLVKVWNNHNGRDDLLNLGGAWIDPVRGQHPLDLDGGNNMFLHAVNERALRTGVEQRLVFVTKGGLDLGNWYSGAAIQAMLARTLAVLEEARVGQLNSLLWMGHESTGGVSVSTHLGRWNAVKRELRNAGHITTSTPIVMGECEVGHTSSNAYIEACAIGKTARAPLKMLPTFDGTHYTGESLVTAGGLMAGVLEGLNYVP